MRNLKGQRKNRIQIRLHKRSIKKAQIEQISERIAELLGLERAEISIYITDDETIRHLNRDYRGKDEPTDVLSFPICEKVGNWLILGDIVISLDTAKKQASQIGHSLEEEIKRLLAHGFVHLLGYDHELGGEEERKFFELESYVLKNL